MKKIFPFFVSLLLLPAVASAQGVISLFDDFISVVIVVIPILLSMAVLVFFWGLVKFISKAGDEKEIEEGKQLIVWGLITIFVMVAFWGILGWLQYELGLDDYGAPLGAVSEQPSTIPSL